MKAKDTVFTTTYNPYRLKALSFSCFLAGFLAFCHELQEFHVEQEPQNQGECKLQLNLTENPEPWYFWKSTTNFFLFVIIIVVVALVVRENKKKKNKKINLHTIKRYKNDFIGNK